MSIPVSEQLIFHHGVELTDSVKSLENFGIVERDILVVRQRKSAVVRDKPFKVSDLQGILGRNTSSSKTRSKNNSSTMDAHSSTTSSISHQNEMDASVQKLLEERIRFQNVDMNMQQAYEHHPENFAQVTMLYVLVYVNKVAVQAFVDTGAQMTIISKECVEKCHLGHLVDHRFQGVAQGVGTAPILGRIHLADMKIGTVYLPCAFTVLQQSGLELILGLDMLRRHQCILDLSRFVLRVGNIETPFLSEGEIPPSSRLNPKKQTIVETTSDSSGASSSSQPSAQPSLGLSSSKVKAADNLLPAQKENNNVNFSEKDIEVLIGLGFNREQAISALVAAEGNVDMAASLLL